MYILHYIIYLKTPPIPSMMSKSTEPSFEKNHKQEFHVVSSPRGVEYITAFQRHLKKKKKKKKGWIVLTVRKSDPFTRTMCSVTDIDFLHSATMTTPCAIDQPPKYKKSCKIYSPEIR